MENTVTLQPMTYEMYHRFFRHYQNDPDLYLDPLDFREYTYDPQWVDAYIEKQNSRQRHTFAILHGEQIVGELKIYDIIPRQSAWMGITMISPQFKDKGIGTQAEHLAIRYVFDQLDIPALYADSVLTNTRSQHVLEKVGFELFMQDGKRKYYRILRH